MVDRSSTSTADARSPGIDPDLRPRLESVIVLEGLLKTLFPEPPSLDCITVDDVLRRYRLTGLGAPALQAIEQSQRIVRSRGEYSQSGLCEFHIGLIYLNWDDPRAAANQFTLARQAWSLASDPPAICLAHFAQGLALYHAFHNEPAMLQFGRAERLLNKPPIGPNAARQVALMERMQPLLLVAQEELRRDMWPADRAPEGRDEARYLTVPPLRPAAADGAAESGRNGEPEAGALYIAPSVRPLPPSDARLAFQRQARPPERSGRVPLPISNLPGGLGDLPRGPVPGHIAVDDRFGWYVIAENRSHFLPAGAGTWLLADRDVDELERSEREYVIVGSRQVGLGSIVVQPVTHSSTVPYCYLGYRGPAADGVSTLFLEDNNPINAGDLLLLAVVEGFWTGAEGLVGPADRLEARE